MSRHPTVKWAQRSEELSITVELPDAQDVKLKVEPEGKFYFSATAGAEKIPYEVNVDLFDSIDVNDIITSASSRQICYLVKKAENKWWDRLLKQGGKIPSFLKIDWDKWVDEDEYYEQEAKPASDKDLGDIDFSKLNMGGGDGLELDAAGDDDDDESDSEEEDTDEASSGIEVDPKDTVSGDRTVAPDTKA
ncbi:putative HSP20-like chaperone [Medicago truncatula]|uniref:Co-chaperone protein p23 n=1 Tax=Medicago truncatula TaxID=3880 RepID=G7KQ71_MEDTR|nr:co-chaperone protein p23-1 [Medicago truncatula]AES75244.1 HSP90 co-chaperone [Medicago truncatula]RHN51152.1 putative HSP20-like chaperone [Medicago truncatula]